MDTAWGIRDGYVPDPHLPHHRPRTFLPAFDGISPAADGRVCGEEGTV